MIAQSEKKSQTGMIVTIAAVLLLLGTGAFLLWKHQKDTPPTTIIKEVPKPETSVNASQISKANEDKVVFIEMGWKLMNTQTGEELYQVYLPVKTSAGIISQAAYIHNSQGRTEPYLVTKSQAPSGASIKPIGGLCYGQRVRGIGAGLYHHQPPRGSALAHYVSFRRRRIPRHVA